MRDDPVPCKNATQYEIDNGKHLTWDDDTLCNPCKRVLDRFVLRRQQAEALERAEARAEGEAVYANWNTGECEMCGGAGILGVRNDAHPSMYGMNCPDCEDDYEGETP